MQTLSLRSKFKGAILGTAIGDALGAPMETMFAADIKKIYPEFSEKNCNYIEAKIGRRADEKIKPGSWTDDTQLMIPTINSIIECGGINPANIAKHYAIVYETEKRRGWGRSTIESVEKLVDGANWFEASETCMGTGNGAAMKAAPLGLVLSHLFNKDKLNFIHCCNSVIDVGKITHKEAGIKAGFLQSLLIAFAVHKPNTHFIETYESLYFDSRIFSQKVRELNKYKSIEQIAKHGGVTSRAEESWPTVAAVYHGIINNKFKPLFALFELIKQGGDTDTTGAMLGALIGAQYGVDIFPKQLIRNLEDYEYLTNLASELYDCVRS